MKLHGDIDLMHRKMWQRRCPELMSKTQKLFTVHFSRKALNSWQLQLYSLCRLLICHRNALSVILQHGLGEEDIVESWWLTSQITFFSRTLIQQRSGPHPRVPIQLYYFFGLYVQVHTGGEGSLELQPRNLGGDIQSIVLPMDKLGFTVNISKNFWHKQDCSFRGIQGKILLRRLFAVWQEKCM